MPINTVQFQKGLSLPQFLLLYGTNEQCEAAVVKMRWPKGFICTKCACKRYAPTHNGRKLWECLGCGYQSSSIAGTVFEHTKLPLSVWFLGIYLVTQSKNAISALELKRQLGIGYKAAWLMKHKLLQTMFQRETNRKLEGRIELDDAYLGGEHEGKRGRGSPNKTPFVAAVQTNGEGKPMFMRLSPVSGFTRDALEHWANANLTSNSQVVSDGLWCFAAVKSVGASHAVTVVSSLGSARDSVKLPQFKWVNTMLGNLKNSLRGTYHAFSYRKYAHRYLAEFAYRFNRRYDLTTILPRLLYAIVSFKPLPLSKLRLSEAGR
jgi:ribosomal protein L37AE/L43A